MSLPNWDQEFSSKISSFQFSPTWVTMVKENFGENEENKIELVATSIPEGVIVHTELGISKNANGPSILNFGEEKLEKVMHAKNLRAVLASEVGLEWRDYKSGKKINASDTWAKESYVLVSDKK